MNLSGKKILIWDIDGTLLNTAPGIINSVRYAEKMVGLSPLDDEQVRVFLGPPPKSMYMKMYGLDEKTASEAVKYHREYSRNRAIYEADVYDGIPSVLEYYQNKGIHQAIATLKGQTIADTIIERLELSKYFDIIAAMDKDETKTKNGLLQEVIDYLGLDHKDAVLIGDSQYDAIGAEKAGIDFVGVTYGFGFHSIDDVNKYPNIGVVMSVKELM